MKIFSSILIVVNVYFNPYGFASRLSKSEEIQKLSGFIDYGNWCGPGHGGYQDCCNGEPCSSCNLNDGNPSKTCLLEKLSRLPFRCHNLNIGVFLLCSFTDVKIAFCNQLKKSWS